MTLSKIRAAALMVVMLLTAAGCSSTNLGQIDETQSEREEMPGPGIFDDESGGKALKWSSDDRQSSPAQAQAGETALDEKAEFEEFKKWNRLRTENAESAEYQEFLQWLEYRKFKTSE